MAGMGFAPKPADQRARKNKPALAVVQLPPEGRSGEAPPWPFAKKSPSDQALWVELWSTPQAAAWERMGPGVARMVARYVVTAGQAGRDPRLLAEIRQLEDRLGLNPLAMRRLGWEIAQDEVAPRRLDLGAQYEGLRAVAGGSGAVAGA